MVKKISEIEFYTDCLIVEAIFKDETMIKNAFDGGSIISSMIGSVKEYFQQHIDPSNPGTSIMSLLVPGTILTIFKSLGFTKIGILFGLLTSVFNIDIKSILDAICGKIKGIVSGDKKVSSGEITNIVTSAVNSNTGAVPSSSAVIPEEFRTDKDDESAEVSEESLDKILQGLPKRQKPSEEDQGIDTDTDTDEEPYMSSYEAVQKLKEEERQRQLIERQSRPEPEPSQAGGAEGGTEGSGESGGTTSGGTSGSGSSPTSYEEPNTGDFGKDIQEKIKNKQPGYEDEEGKADLFRKMNKKSSELFFESPFESKNPLIKNSIKLSPRDVYLFKLSLNHYQQLIKNAESADKKSGLLGGLADAATKQTQGKGILIKLLSWFFSIMLSSAGFLVAGDVVNKFLGRPNAFDDTSGPEIEAASATTSPTATQNVFPLKQGYTQENYNTGSNSWTVNATANEDGISDMIIKFTKDVYNGLDGKEQYITNSPKFKDLLRIFLAENSKNYNSNVVIVPRSFHSKKQIADYFINSVASSMRS